MEKKKIRKRLEGLGMKQKKIEEEKEEEKKVMKKGCRMRVDGAGLRKDRD